jgi:8-oxo-dGTP pyrophosphatase MutT (NUDIX family)
MTRSFIIIVIVNNLLAFTSTLLILANHPLCADAFTLSRTNIALKMSNKLEEDLPRIDSEERVASTRWLALDTYHWTDQEGKERKWDVAVRTTKDSTSDSADAVVIIPLLRSKSNPGKIETLLVEQYRPPMRRTTLEFPAGLIDKGESVENAALRELREETGYVGEKCAFPPQVSRQVCMSPGLTNESVQVAVVEVDLDNPYNHGTPTPQLDDGEFCIVKRLALTEGLKQMLDDESNAMPIMGLYLFALGLELGASTVTK